MCLQHPLVNISLTTRKRIKLGEVNSYTNKNVLSPIFYLSSIYATYKIFKIHTHNCSDLNIIIKCPMSLYLCYKYLGNWNKIYWASLINRNNGQQHTVKIPTDQNRAPIINSLSTKSAINPGVTPGRVKYRYFRIVIAGVIMIQA